jgi:trimeric autotransporter adhesin
MKLLVILAALVAVASASSSSSSSSSSSATLPSVISSVTYLPATIVTQIAEAYSYAADITTIGSIISTIALSSPSITYAESVIASYEQSYSSVISYIESIYSSPSLLAPSSVSSFSYLTSIHSTLASAIATVVSIESSHYSLESVQSTLESVEVSQSSILSYLTEYTAIASPSIYYATEVIAEATITSSSIVPTFVAVYTAVSDYPAVSLALSSLSSQLYTLPSTVVSEIVSYISSPSTVSPSVLSSLSYCYGSVYSELTSIVEFTYSHSTDVSPITNLIYAESSVASLSCAIYTVMVSQLPTLFYQTSVISAISYTLPSVYTDVEYLSYFEASSPTLSYALSTIEETFYESPSIASSIYQAIVSPSSVTNPTQISYEEISHQSFVSAITALTSFESAYTSIASTVSSIVYSLTSAFETERTLLTAVDYVSDLTSPSYYSASIAISSLLSVVSDIPTVLSYISSVLYSSPSLSCYESAIEVAAYYYPYYISQLWEVYNSPSLITDSFSYYSYLEAEYSTAAYAISQIVSAESTFTSLSSYETSFISAASQDSSLITEESYASSDYSSISSAISSIQS